jgi:hypothetical protein
MNENERYDLVCKEKFDDLASGQKEILGLLRGANGRAGLVERVRLLEKISKALAAAAVFFLGVLAVEGAAWIIEIIKGKG